MHFAQASRSGDAVSKSGRTGHLHHVQMAQRQRLMSGIGGADALLAVAILSLLFLSGCGGGSGAARPIPDATASVGLFPSFRPNEHYYVSRCGNDGQPAAIRPGEGKTRTYRIRCLPRDFPPWRFESIRPVPQGLFVVTYTGPKDGRPWVIVFDTEGVPRWWFNPDTRALWGQIIRNGNVVWARSFGDGYGLDPRMAHEVRSEAGRLLRLVRTQGSIVDGHEYRELPNGNVLLDTYVPETADLRRFGGPRHAAIVSAEVQEVDPAGKVLWHWSSRGHISLRETGRWWHSVLSNSRPRLHREAFDPVHVNSIEPRGRGEVIISTRHTDAVYGIDRSTGEIRWKLGGVPTGESLEVVGDPATKLLGGQHDARLDRFGRLTIFDNGKDRPRRPRVVFYRLDLGTGKAIYKGQLNDPEVRQSHCCGSARELPGGDWLVSWGDNPLVTGFDRKGRIAFRLHLPASTFRAVPAPPGATSIGQLARGMRMMHAR
jgi:hypothetical protein